MVTGFVIDPMHTLDGGLIRLLLTVFVNIPTASGPVTPGILTVMNTTISRELPTFQNFVRKEAVSARLLTV
jgi:hypothetical protein